ncbi:peptidoglycan-binding protein [Variovorax sp. OV329]|uniref:peptidoglycan-binding domain-containing protein n=1 Tax=Variovorax sp. OV329 TaxID=1882825 RepID=UPI0008F2B5F4|nr:peptidoglycan-binding protein [Variovorax sp. OV329]SFL86621.1 hypothetical protein SAMN05444747_10135 [Variovorax sp. OV329]
MTLEEVVTQGKVLTFPQLAGDEMLALQVQKRLGEIGLLDPPADGRFGPVSQWALSEFLRRMLNVPVAERLGAEGARAMLDPQAASLFPLLPGGDFAGRVVSAMLARGDWVCRHPDCLNIVYVDGTDADGAPNEDSHNKFQDVRLLIRVDAGGVPTVGAAWEATTEPGTFYVKTKKLNVEGAAHIVAGQYKAWSVGIHKANTPSAHEALVQTENLRISRDKDENFDPAGDKIFTGMFGINQHWGFDFARDDVRSASAGCLVGRTRNGHRQFMALVKTDPRFRVNNSYRFMSSVLSPQLVHGGG